MTRTAPLPWGAFRPSSTDGGTPVQVHRVILIGDGGGGGRVGRPPRLGAPPTASSGTGSSPGGRRERGGRAAAGIRGPRFASSSVGTMRPPSAPWSSTAATFRLNPEV